MNVEVRNVGLDELNMLMEWRMRVLREVFADVWRDADEGAIRTNNEAYYREHLSDATHTAAFALDSDSGRIVGCGGICYQDEMPSPDNLSGTCGYLMNVFALPELRGKGIGRMIVEFLVADATMRGTGKVYLESSKVAKGLYREMGFVDLPDYMKLPGRIRPRRETL